MADIGDIIALAFGPAGELVKIVGKGIYDGFNDAQTQKVVEDVKAAPSTHPHFDSYIETKPRGINDTWQTRDKDGYVWDALWESKTYINDEEWSKMRQSSQAANIAYNRWQENFDTIEKSIAWVDVRKPGVTSRTAAQESDLLNVSKSIIGNSRLMVSDEDKMFLPTQAYERYQEQVRDYDAVYDRAYIPPPRVINNTFQDKFSNSVQEQVSNVTGALADGLKVVTSTVVGGTVDVASAAISGTVDGLSEITGVSAGSLEIYMVLGGAIALLILLK
jgi:hypothetical protein